MRPASRPRRLAEHQCGVQPFQPWGEVAVLRGQVHCQAGQVALQLLQARDHPARQDTAGAAEHEGVAALCPAQAGHAVAQLRERSRSRFQQALAGGSGADAASVALEQGDAEFFLQRPQLAADRTVGHMQFVGSEADAA